MRDRGYQDRTVPTRMLLKSTPGGIGMSRRVLLLVALVVVSGCAKTERAPTKPPMEHIRLATTSSTEASGLLSYLLPPFEEQENIKVDVIAVGTGKALRLGENGDVDVVMVHNREAEDKFVREGFGVNRRDLMRNDFVIIGPPEDPAKIKGLRGIRKVMQNIAGNAFASRGDESGTHAREMKLWAAAGVTPDGPWYMSTGQGMGETLMIASEKQAYCLTDRATYLAFQAKLSLPILSEGDPGLMNPYGVMAVNPAKHPEVKYTDVMKFIAYLTSAEGQRRIAEFTIDGKQVFFPDAVPQAGRIK